MKVGMLGLFAIVGASSVMIGCGTPSKEDVCGKCGAETKAACELVYDACNDDSDCIEKLEDAKPCG